MPLQRLHEKPVRNAIIADLTCDCDGKLSHFADNAGPKTTLPLHELDVGEDYLLGAFLVGQELNIVDQERVDRTHLAFEIIDSAVLQGLHQS